MPTQSRATIAGWFIRGAKPLAAQFSTWLDSFVHKDDAIAMSSITGLETALAATATVGGVKGLYRAELTMTNVDGNYTINPGNCIMMMIPDVTVPDAGAVPSINFKIGDTNGGEELLGAIPITTNNAKPETIMLPIYAKTSRTIYFGGIAGTGATVRLIILLNTY